MCDLCLKTPCDSRCPNAPLPKAFGVCAECGDVIYDGDEYWELGGEYYCESCVDGAHSTADVNERGW